MSADNWTICPKCKVKYDIDQQVNEESIHKSYGQISEEAYLKLIQSSKSKFLDETLREDFYIGINEDIFSVRYSALCDRCGFKFSYKYEKQIVL